MEYHGLYISSTPDCDENQGGYYCQVYTDEYMEKQIDGFCVHPDELRICSDLDYWIRIYVDDMYPIYLMNNDVPAPEQTQEQTM